MEKVKSVNGGYPEVCRKCNGTGEVAQYEYTRHGHGDVLSYRTCPVCKGERLVLVIRHTTVEPYVIEKSEVI